MLDKWQSIIVTQYYHFWYNLKLRWKCWKCLRCVFFSLFEQIYSPTDHTNSSYGSNPSTPVSSPPPGKYLLLLVKVKMFGPRSNILFQGHQFFFGINLTWLYKTHISGGGLHQDPIINVLYAIWEKFQNIFFLSFVMLRNCFLF